MLPSRNCTRFIVCVAFRKKIFFFVGGVLVWVGCVGVLKGHFTLIELCSLWFCSRLFVWCLFGTMLRNVGGAIGPILATSIMAPYTAPVQGVSRVVAYFANEAAFNTIFAVAIALTAIVIAISLAIQNYVVAKKPSAVQ